VSAVAARLESIPFAEMGAKLDSALGSIEAAVDGPELRQTVVALARATAELRELSARANAGLGPALDALPQMSARLDEALERAEDAFGRGGYGTGSTIQRNLEQMTDEVGEAARSVRLLADYLNRHPESLVRGRDPEAP
jgi:paraquat-inducible protein B